MTNNNNDDDDEQNDQDLSLENVRIDKAMFNNIMEKFEQSVNSHPINAAEEQKFLEGQAKRQDHLHDAYSKVDFDLKKGTLIKINLGPKDSEQRKFWKYPAYRPADLEENDTLLYVGWFERVVKIFDRSSKIRRASPDERAENIRKLAESLKAEDSPYNNPRATEVAEYKVDPYDKEESGDLPSLFSSRIQLFVKAGKEETWAGLIPSFYYDIVAEGSGEACMKPLHVESHSLGFNKDSIKKMVLETSAKNEARKLSTLPQDISLSKEIDLEDIDD